MMPTRMPESRLLTPETIPFTRYRAADAAVARLAEIYARNTAFLRERYTEYAQGKAARSERIRAYYPALRLAVDTYQEVDSRLSYGHVVEPGVTPLPPDRSRYFAPGWVKHEKSPIGPSARTLSPGARWSCSQFETGPPATRLTVIARVWGRVGVEEIV